MLLIRGAVPCAASMCGVAADADQRLLDDGAERATVYGTGTALVYVQAALSPPACGAMLLALAQSLGGAEGGA